jgi:hypothetical protein
VRRIISVITVAALMAVMLVAMAAPAFAHSGGSPGPNTGGPSGHENPYADNHRYGKDAKGGQCITTYKGPSTPPDDASGGNPGYEFNKDVGAAC